MIDLTRLLKVPSFHEGALHEQDARVRSYLASQTMPGERARDHGELHGFTVHQEPAWKRLRHDDSLAAIALAGWARDGDAIVAGYTGPESTPAYWRLPRTREEAVRLRANEWVRVSVVQIVHRRPTAPLCPDFNRMLASMRGGRPILSAGSWVPYLERASAGKDAVAIAALAAGTRASWLLALRSEAERIHASDHAAELIGRPASDAERWQTGLAVAFARLREPRARVFVSAPEHQMQAVAAAQMVAVLIERIGGTRAAEILAALMVITASTPEEITEARLRKELR